MQHATYPTASRGRVWSPDMYGTFESKRRNQPPRKRLAVIESSRPSKRQDTGVTVVPLNTKTFISLVGFPQRISFQRRLLKPFGELLARNRIKRKPRQNSFEERCTACDGGGVPQYYEALEWILQGPWSSLLRVPASGLRRHPCHHNTASGERGHHPLKPTPTVAENKKNGV